MRAGVALLASAMVHMAVVLLVTAFIPRLELDEQEPSERVIPLSLFATEEVQQADDLTEPDLIPDTPTNTEQDQATPIVPQPVTPEPQLTEDAFVDTSPAISKAEVPELQPEPKPKAKPQLKPNPRQDPVPSMPEVAFTEERVQASNNDDRNIEIEKDLTVEPVVVKEIPSQRPSLSSPVSASNIADLELTYSQSIRQSVASKRIYPRAAKRRGVRGIALVSFRLSADGKLRASRVVRSSGIFGVQIMVYSSQHYLRAYPDERSQSPAVRYSRT